MILYAPRLFAVVLALVFVAPGWSIPAGKDKPRRQPPGTGVQRALDCCITLELMDTPLPNVLRQLSEMAHVPIVWDRNVAYGNPDEMLVALRAKDTKLRHVLQNVTGQHGLTFGIVGDHIIVGTEEIVNLRQLRQRVDVSLDHQPLSRAINDLAMQTGANVVLDPRARKAAEEAYLSLVLNDTPLETAVRLMAELGGLCVVRLGNVLFVTTEDRAEKLKSESEAVRAPVKETAPTATQQVPQPQVLPAGPAPAKAVPPPPQESLPPSAFRVLPHRGTVRQRLANLLEMTAFFISSRLLLQ
jgi:hypothetical protein